MEEKVKEVKHIMIPVKEYRKLIAKIERQKILNKDTTENYENCRRWWKEEEAKRKDLENSLQRRMKSSDSTRKSLKRSSASANCRRLRSCRMLTIEDARALERLEEAWLNPDSDEYGIDREEIEYERSDIEWQERVCST